MKAHPWKFFSPRRALCLPKSMPKPACCRFPNPKKLFMNALKTVPNPPNTPKPLARSARQRNSLKRICSWFLVAELLNLRVYHRSYKAYRTYLRTSNPDPCAVSHVPKSSAVCLPPSGNIFSPPVTRYQKPETDHNNLALSPSIPL